MLLEEQKGGSVTTKNLKKRNDFLLIVGLLVVALIFGAILVLTGTEGDKAVVLVDGVVYGEYSLSQNRTVEIKTAHGTNVLVIEDGVAYMKEASCPDGVCVGHRPAHFSWQSIICKPNGVVVEIHSATPEEQPDIII